MTPGGMITENNRLGMTGRENNLTMQISYLRLGKSYPLRRLGRERQRVIEVAGARCQQGRESRGCNGFTNHGEPPRQRLGRHPVCILA